MKASEYLKQLETGAFILVEHEGKRNVMTIGWGGLVRMWDRDILMVPVRTSRYTHELLQAVDEFIVSVPPEGAMLDELSFCGSRSGRNIDKIKDCDLTPSGGMVGCKNYRAKIILRQPMEEDKLDEAFLNNYYPLRNLHVLYYCEISDLDD